MRQYSTLKKRSRNRRPLVIAAVLLLVLAIGAGAWAYKRSSDAPKVGTTISGSSVDLSPATKEDNEAGDIRKSSPDPDKTLNDGSSDENIPFATTLNVNVVSNGDGSRVIHAGTIVNGTTTGKCTLTLSQTGQQSVVRTADVQQNVNTYDCGVFNIATSDLPASGQWKLTLTVAKDGKQASDNATVAI